MTRPLLKAASPASPAVRLPDHFSRRSAWLGLYCVVHALVLWVGFGLLGLVIYRSEGLPAGLRLLLCVPCILIAGMGLFYTTTLSHEGFHGNLHPDHHVSMSLGMTVSALVPLYLCVGYTATHWPHHVYTNTADDPDFAAYSRYPGFFSRVFMGPARSAWGFQKNTVLLLLRSARVDLRHYPFSPRVASRYAAANVVLALLFLGGHVALGLHDPAITLFTLVLPFGVATAYLGMVPFIDHAGTGLARGTNARSYTSPVFTALLLGTNYHREHHLYAAVPSYKLPRLHRFLNRHGYPQSPGVVEPGFWAALRIGATHRLRRQ